MLTPWSTREGAEGFKCADFEMIRGPVDFEGTGGPVDFEGAGGVVILTVEFVLIVLPVVTTEVVVSLTDEESERLSGVAKELEIPLFVITIFESFVVVAVAYGTPPTDPILSDLLGSVSEVGEKSSAEVTTGTDCE